MNNIESCPEILMQISYSAVVAEAKLAKGKDPQKVARVEDAKKFGGLMTIVMRR